MTTMTKNEAIGTMLKVQTDRGQAQGKAYFINLVQSLETQLSDAKRYQKQFLDQMSEGSVRAARDQLVWALSANRQTVSASSDAEKAISTLDEASGLRDVKSLFASMGEDD